MINLILSWLMKQPWEHTLFQLCLAYTLWQVKSWKNILDKISKNLSILSQVSFILQVAWFPLTRHWNIGNFKLFANTVQVVQEKQRGGGKKEKFPLNSSNESFPSFAMFVYIIQVIPIMVHKIKINFCNNAIWNI